MYTMLKKIGTRTVLIALLAATVFAQPKPAFEVATIKPAAPLDQAKIIAALQGGGKMPVGANVDNKRAEYTYMDLKSLIAFAYGVKPYQITGPDWMATTRFDIVAKLPDGSTKDDAPKMLQALLEDRFKMATHRSTAEHPVLALVAAKGGSKLKASTEKPVAIDENAPLAPGQIKMDSPEGPIRMSGNLLKGNAVIDMGLKGKMTYTMNAASQSMHIDLSMVTMDGFADMMTQMLAQFGGGNGRQIVNMTDIKGNYEAAIDISLADMIAMARNAGMDVPGGGQGPAGAGNPGPAAGSAPDPSGGGQTVTDAIQSMGLKLESRKAMVEQFIVDHVEKAPTEN